MSNHKSISGPVLAIVTAIVLISSAFTARASQAGTLGLEFSGNEVTVTGAQRSRQVILFGIGIGRYAGYLLHTREASVLTDDDGDGKITREVYQVPQRSVWVAIDAETGEYVVATPTGAAPSVLNIADGSWRGSNGYVDVGARRYLEALAVRPRAGAWALRITEGGSNDGDGLHNGVLRLRLDKMKILSGEEQGPAFAIPNDVIVMIDPMTLETFAGEAR